MRGFHRLRAPLTQKLPGPIPRLATPKPLKLFLKQVASWPYAPGQSTAGADNPYQSDRPASDTGAPAAGLSRQHRSLQSPPGSEEPSKNCPIRLHHTGYTDAETGIYYTFLTNDFKLAATTIAVIYKARWQIELFCKWIKQNLKIKSFLSTSKNAVMTRIWIAMCVYLLLSYIKFLHKIQPSIQPILRLLQLNLFERRDPLELLRSNPSEPPVSPNQATLIFS